MHLPQMAGRNASFKRVALFATTTSSHPGCWRATDYIAISAQVRWNWEFSLRDRGITGSDRRAGAGVSPCRRNGRVTHGVPEWSPGSLLVWRRTAAGPGAHCRACSYSFCQLAQIRAAYDRVVDAIRNQAAGSLSL